MKRMVFWQNIMSPHQVPYIRELPMEPGVEEVVLVVATTMTVDRTSLGWSPPSTGRVKVYVAPDRSTIDQLLSKAPDESLHVLGGFRNLPYTEIVLSARQEYGFRCGTIVEGADVRSWEGMIRQLLYRWEAYRYRKRFDFILAMGENGFRWYCDNGWPVEKVFSFAYITELRKIIGDLQGKPSPNDKTSPVQLLYIGQMIQRKGVDILLRALANISAGSNWHLSLLGSGPREKAYREMTDRLGLGAQVSFLGSRPHPEVLDEINRADLLVLPSRFDGWGAVINESLICGTPVLCSDLCGAKDLLAETWRGEAIPAGNVIKWTAGLSRWIAKGRLPAPERGRIREWSASISGPAGARYFMAIMGHVYHNSLRPIPPWQSGQP